MSPTTMIILNAVLDCAVIAVLAYVMYLPSRLRFLQRTAFRASAPTRPSNSARPSVVLLGLLRSDRRHESGNGA